MANQQLFRALALHGGFDPLYVLTDTPADRKAVAEALSLHGQAADALRTSGPNPRVLGSVGTLLRGAQALEGLAWLRRRTLGDPAFSMVGLIHTLAPPAVREQIADLLTAPVQPWDALICTSPSVRDAVSGMLGDWGDFLAERTGGGRPPLPALPIVPLGVDAEAIAARRTAERRSTTRAELGLADEDPLVLWVGRLSYFEKAFPQPMLRALEEASAATGRRITFVMAGWFPHESHAAFYEEAAAAYAPSVRFVVADGNDAHALAGLWSGADVFLSLVDNIQETFGITPLEAMAAGLPVVASDWDGYRFTVRDGVEGFLIPTLGGPPGGPGLGLAAPHAMGLESYQTYVGAVASHTAVHVGRAAEALATLINDPERRRAMGAAGQARVRDAFDWPVVARAYRQLFEELARLRPAKPEAAARRIHPVKGDPFRDFSRFATQVPTAQTRFRLRAGASLADLERTQSVKLDQTFAGRRASTDECAAALHAIAAAGELTYAEILNGAPAERREALALGVGWMCKLGILDWL